MRVHGILTTLVLIPTGVSAQGSHEVAVDASVFGVGVSYARQLTSHTLLGFEIGVGVPQLDVTLTPREAAARSGSIRLEEFLYLAAFARFQATERFEVDTGVRVGAASLYECMASDCWPESFVGTYVQPMVGGRRVKVGARLVAGLVGGDTGSDSRTFAVAIRPLIVRLTLPW